jgi:HTH-type transcriptional regulator / antitoxin HipB
MELVSGRHPSRASIENPFDRMDQPARPNPARASARLGLALRNRRKSLGLTQGELSRLAGCGLAFLYELEIGKPTVRLDKVLAVVGVLGLELSLVEGKDALRVDAHWLTEET